MFVHLVLPLLQVRDFSVCVPLLFHFAYFSSNSILPRF
jgi:hypothetical protein